MKPIDLVGQSIDVIRCDVSCLVDLMLDGTPLITASSNIAKEFYARVSPGKGANEFLSQLFGNSGLRVSACICGWNSAGAAVDDTRKSLMRAATSLRGAVAVLALPIEMLDVIADDSYSFRIYERILSNPPIQQDLRSRAIGMQTVRDVTNLLEDFLRGNVASYFLTRYELGVRQIREFVIILSDALAGLSDERLAALSTADGSEAARAATRTVGMRALLNHFEVDLAPATIERLRQLAWAIETSTSKQAAASRLATK